jgi:putative ABC transport system permease protein
MTTETDLTNLPIDSRPLWRVTARRIWRRPLQYILLILGVAIGVAMMVAIDLANSSASRAFQLSTDAVAGKTTHRIVGGPTGLDEEIYRRVRVEAGFRPSAPVVEGYVAAPALGGQPLRLVGVDPFAEPPFRSYFGEGGQQLNDGLVFFLTQPNAILLAETTAVQHNLNLGDEIELLIGGRSVTAQIVGLLQPEDEMSRRALESLIFTDVASAQETLAMVGRLSHIDLIVENEADLATLAALLPPAAQIETAAARSNALLQMSAAFELNLTALSLLALVVGMFLIYNTVTFSVVQRRPLFAVLRCLGVTGGQLFGLILAEAFIFSLIGSALGVGLGILLGRGLVGLVTQTINDFYFVVNVQNVTVQAWTIVKGLGIGVAAGLAASLLPAWEAMGSSPLSALRRSSLESKATAALPWLAGGFAVLAAVGSLLLWLPGLNLLFAFTGLFMILFACALLTPILTVGLMGLITPLSGQWFGPLGRMAPRDIVRSLSRSSVAIAALMVAVSVIVGVSIMIGSFRQTVSQWLNNTLQADIYLSPPALTSSRVEGTLAADAVALASGWPGVEYAVTARNLTVMAPDFGRMIEVVGVDGDVSAGNRAYAWIDGRQADLWPRFLAGEGILVSETLILRENLSIPPPPITLQTDEGPRSYPVLAILYEYSSDQGIILMAREQFVAGWRDERIGSLGLFVVDGRNTDEIVAEIRGALNGRQDVVIQSNQAIRANALDIFDRTFAITAALQLLATLVAFIGVLSALMSLQLERARELGILRATGMTVNQMWRLTLLETGLMGGVAGLLAMPVGWILAWVLIYVINLRSFGWTLEMALNPVYFGQAFLVALVAALLAGVYPATRLGSMVIATAIRQE